MLFNNRGNEVPEYIVVGAVVIALTVAILYTIMTTVQSKGTGVNTYIGGITVPAAP
ncbi:MAG: hypothetical protein AAB427_07430 [Chloroflexota bacterium]